MNSFSFRVYDLVSKRYLDIPLYIDQNGELCDSSLEKGWFDGRYIKEKCANVKDKNGNIMYEGDVVKCENGALRKIVWWDSQNQFAHFGFPGREMPAGFLSQSDVDGVGMEIIGNIHENKDWEV